MCQSNNEYNYNEIIEELTKFSSSYLITRVKAEI